jgi:hypothetical protein
MRVFDLLLIGVLNCGFVALGADGSLATSEARLDVVNPAIPTGADFSMPAVQLPARSVRTIIHGVVTWVDKDRKLVVLQDGTNAVALRPDLPWIDLTPGERVVLEGQVSPLIAAFPDYPDKPAGSEICRSFEGPTNWAEYYLTRMRGFLRPPVTGRYTFWIASDDGSELWLSENAGPARAKKAASVGYGNWTGPREWEKFPSQQSKEYELQAGTDYYIEAIAFNGWGNDCLAVAWQGPGMGRSVIEGRYLSPWHPGGNVLQEAGAPVTNGILREYWRNFYSSDLSVLRVPDPSILNLWQARIVDRQTDRLPAPVVIQAGRILRPEENYRHRHSGFEWLEMAVFIG